MKAKHRRISFASGAVFLIAGGLATPAAAQAATKASYDIAPQPLGPALKRFARENGVQVLFAEADVAGRTTRGLNGRFTPGEALARLVDDARLTVRTARPKVYVIRSMRRPAASRPILAAAQATDQPSRPSEPSASDSADGNQAPAAPDIAENEAAAAMAAADLRTISEVLPMPRAAPKSRWNSRTTSPLGRPAGGW